MQRVQSCRRLAHANDEDTLIFLLQQSCLSIRDHPAIEEGAADVVEPALVTPLTEVLRAAPMWVDEVSFLVTRPWIRTFTMRRKSFAMKGDTESAVPLLASASPRSKASHVCRDARVGSLAHHDHL